MHPRDAHQAVLPSRANGYRPHGLRRSSLVAFLAIILLSEAALVGAQFQTPAMRASVAAVVAAPSQSSIINQTLRQIDRFLSDPTSGTDWLLGAVAVILAALIIFAFVMRPQVQPMHALAPAMALVCMAIVLIALNVVVLGGASGQTASVSAVER